MRALNKLHAVLFAATILSGCSNLQQEGRLSLTLPPEMTAVYSEVNMRLMLVTRADAPSRCTEPACNMWDDVDQRVARIGPDLAKSAYRLYPDIGSRVRNFEFIVADKSEPGTVSASSGRIIVLRPVGSLAPNDAAFAFILAREIGHVVANHHEENVTATLIVSALVHLIAPVANLTQLFGNLFLANAATGGASASIAANAAMTATSFVGSRVLLTTYKPRQRDEADLIAMSLLAQLGYDLSAVAAAFAAVNLNSPDTEWTSSLRASVAQLSAPPPPARTVVLDSHPSVP
ncbi:MAG: M48 family metalloprotease [Chloroflexota bacterium]